MLVFMERDPECIVRENNPNEWFIEVFWDCFNNDNKRILITEFTFPYDAEPLVNGKQLCGEKTLEEYKRLFDGILPDDLIKINLGNSRHTQFLGYSFISEIKGTAWVCSRDLLLQIRINSRNGDFVYLNREVYGNDGNLIMKMQDWKILDKECLERLIEYIKNNFKDDSELLSWALLMELS